MKISIQLEALTESKAISLGITGLKSSKLGVTKHA